MYMKAFLLSLQKLSEASDMPRYAYSYMGNQPIPKKHFADNCIKLAADIEKSAKGTTYHQADLLKSIARHVKNQNLLLAQDVIDKLDPKTKKMIPEMILKFIERNA